MSVYMIIDSKVKDREKYRRYIDQVSPIVAKYGGHYHVREEKIRSLGVWKPERIIVLEFPTEDHIQKWLTSPEYKAIAPLREEGAETQAILVDGYPNNKSRTSCSRITPNEPVADYSCYTRKATMKNYEIEHIGIAVEKPIEMAKWYQEVLGFNITFSTQDDEKGVAFLTDCSNRVMLEFGKIPNVSPLAGRQPSFTVTYRTKK